MLSFYAKMFSGFFKHHFDAPSVNIQFDDLLWGHKRVSTHERQWVHNMERRGAVRSK
jgi:hypothetical protein